MDPFIILKFIHINKCRLRDQMDYSVMTFLEKHLLQFVKWYENLSVFQFDLFHIV